MTRPSQPPPTTETRAPRGTILDILSPLDRAELLRLGTMREYDESRVLLREGDRSSHVLLLLRAIAKVTATLETGRLALMEIRVSGDIVGEMAAMDGGPRMATVTTTGSAVLRVIQRPEFVDFLRSSPDAGMAVCGMISRRLRLTHQRRLDFHNYQVGIRLARVLVELAEMCGRPVEGGIGFDFGLPQRDLAAIVDADVDTVGKELRKLRDQGMIRYSYRKILICDLPTLKKIACLPGQGPHDGL